jgi:hypothetical protein
MASNAELRRAIREMSEVLAERVIKLISSMSLQQLAELTGKGSSDTRAVTQRDPYGLSSKAKSKDKARRKSGHPAKPTVHVRKIRRRNGAEIEKLRKGVLDALKSSDEWLSINEIGAKIGPGIGADELSFPINYLRARGLVQKMGERSQTRYKITDAGRAHDGNFTSKSIAPPEPAQSDANR